MPTECRHRKSSCRHLVRKRTECQQWIEYQSVLAVSPLSAFSPITNYKCYLPSKLHSGHERMNWLKQMEHKPLVCVQRSIKQFIMLIKRLDLCAIRSVSQRPKFKILDFLTCRSKQATAVMGQARSLFFIQHLLFDLQSFYYNFKNGCWTWYSGCN